MRPILVRRALIALTVVGMVAGLTGLTGLTGPAGRAFAQSGDPADPAAALAQKYAPVVVLRQQKAPCGQGERYIPRQVESVLGRPGVVLRDPKGTVVKEAPTAADLYGLDEGYHLDLPGNALSPGCTYETWAREVDAPATVYAHVVSDPEHPDTIVLQYWLYWVFNDWNDRHESDWEMIQLVFEAETAAEALAIEPSQVAYAQHEGAQVVDWGDADLRTVDGRPVIYSAQGSHASHYSQHRWFGKSAATGFGCDDTTTPSRRIDPAVVLLPDDLTGADDPFAWLAFEGHWGEKEPVYNDGPTGPNTKEQWSNPVTWVEGQGRDGAISLPEFGGPSTDLFCFLSAEGSLLFLRFLQEPWLVVGASVLVILLLVVLIRQTGWSPGHREPIVSRRQGGEVLRSAVRLVRHHWSLFGGIGLVILGAGVVAVGLQHLVFELTPVGTASDVVDDGSAWSGGLALLAGALVTVPAAGLVYTACSHAVLELAGERLVTAGVALRAAAHRPAGIMTVVLIAVVLGIGIGTVVFIPFALYLLARWAVAVPAEVWEGIGLRAGLRRSRELTRGERIRTLLVAGTALLVAGATGPMIGTIVLLVSDISLRTANLLAGLIGLFTVPTAAVAINLLYVDRRLRREPAWSGPAEPVSPRTGG